MDLVCYTYDGWKPRIRPASSRRDWMDASPESYAYRCLPLKIANAHGWEVLSPCGFSAEWNGGPAPGDVSIELDAGYPPHDGPEALFGLGALTFHIAGILQTPPGWNLWVGGLPNEAKDGIAPLSGIIETDWSPFTFTMNWRFTRPNHRIRFEENEPFAFLFPVQRGVIDQFEPKIVPIEDAPELKRQFEEWSRSRDAFQEEMRTNPPSSPAEKWQKFYYRGQDASGCPHIADHQTKVRAAPFAGVNIAPGRPAHSPVTAAPPASPVLTSDVPLAKRDWLLQSLLALRTLAHDNPLIERRPAISGEEFLSRYYARNRPLILTDELKDWKALNRWSPDYLKGRIGGATIDYQGGRSGSADYERRKDDHTCSMPFDAFIELIESSADGNDAYITAYNSGTNSEALAPLAEDIGRLDHLLAGDGPEARGMMWIGGAGTFTPLHHDLTNNLLVQITGTKHVLMVPPEETPRLHNDKHVFSEIQDLENVDPQCFAEVADLQVFRAELGPGEALFIPLGWWHQIVAEDFSVSMTFTNFRWRNDFYTTYPAD